VEQLDPERPRCVGHRGRYGEHAANKADAHQHT
jgi:hypothetical protein